MIQPRGRVGGKYQRGIIIPSQGLFTVNKCVELDADDRPGLQHFLDTMSEFYEMHVYTMGTRTYANAICKVIDPGGKIFGDRILSRDESGSKFSWRLQNLPKLTSRLYVKEFEEIVPHRSEYGSDNRRQTGCLG
jgi:TFIIF-interacting CTD phosphatase-like protein